MSLLTDQSDVLARWAEHFNEVLNAPSFFDHTVLNEIQQWPVSNELAVEPSLNEVQNAVKLLCSGKAPGEDSLPAEIFERFI
jgi:hypothetical protein